MSVPKAADAASAPENDILLYLAPIYAVVAKQPELSAPSLSPLKLLTLSGQDFDPTATVGVRFFDRSGYDVEVPAIDVGTSSLMVSVPPYIDPATGGFSSATVDVQVIQRKSGEVVAETTPVRFEIQALLSPTVPAGLVTLATLETLEVLLPDIASRLTSLDGTDATDLLASFNALSGHLQQLKDAVQAVVDDPSQSVSIGTLNGGPLVVDEASLAALDRLMANFLASSGPNSPSPCPAKDQYIDSLLHNVEFASGETRKQYYGAALTCTSSEILEWSRRNAAALGAIGSIAAVAGVSLGLPVVAVGGLVVVLPAVYAILAETEAMSLTGATRESAENILEAIKQIQNGFLEPTIVGLTTLYGDVAGLTLTVFNAGKAVGDELKVFTDGVDLDDVFFGNLAVTPAGGFNATGTEGGPFSPSSKSYTLENVGNAALDFSAAVNVGWLSLSQGAGTLAPGASTSVNVSINGNAAALDPGGHGATVTFANTTNGEGGGARAVNLTVEAAGLTWTFSANYNANGIDFGCSGVTFDLPADGGNSNVVCDVATVSITVDVPGLSFSVGGFGNINVLGASCSGSGGGSSAIADGATSYTTGGSISGSGTCSMPPDSFPFTVTGSYSASAPK